MLHFAAYTPHSPLLMDSIGKKHLKHLHKTREAMSLLADRFAAARIDTLLVISSHGLSQEKTFSLNLHDVYNCQFKEFGDHGTYRPFHPDLEMAAAISRAARVAQIPLVLQSQSFLDYGSVVPLLLLCGDLNVKVVPISYCADDRKQHLAFGRVLKEVILASPKRIGLIGSGDLSHSLTTSAPVGFRKEGKTFDETVLRSVRQFSVSTLLSMSETIADRAAQCGLKPLLILFGALEQMELQPIVLSYEAPFGVGYLVCDFPVSSS